ncbi:MAG: TonB-dependent receptor plug domain-containing protein [Odoribacter splanchnicus]
MVRIPQQVLEKSSFTDVGKMLQGQVAGVEILQGLGRPGDRVRIRIRGESTLQGDASPLIVIDDIPMPEDYDLNMLNPNDIQNIDVLKGASAAAIYGSKGSAGVLLISTKQGKDGSPEVFYSGNVFFKNFESPVKTLNGDQFRHLIHEAVLNNFKYSSMNNPDANFDIRTSSDYKQVVVPGYFGEANTDWMDVLTRQPVSTNHTLGIRGGNKYAAYYASLGYTEDKGRVVGNDARRISLTSNLDIKATKFLELGLHFTGTKQKIKNSLEPNGWDDGEGLSMAAAARPDIPVYDENGDYYRYYSTGHDRYLNNPLQLAQEAPKTIDRMFYTVSGYLRLLLTKDLRYQMTYSYSETKDDSDLYWGSYTYNGSGGYYNDAKGILDVTNSYSNQSNFDNALYYTKTLENHDVSVMLGTTFNQEKAGNLAQTYQDFPDDYIQNAIYSAAKLLPIAGVTISRPIFRFTGV